MATTTMLGLNFSMSPRVLTTLRLLPLLGTTASLTHAYCEWLTTTSFLTPPATTSSLTKSMTKSDYTGTAPTESYLTSLRFANDIAIPAWFTTFFQMGVKSVVALNSVTTLSTLANLFLFPDGLRESRGFYAVGLVAAVAHFAFVPAVARSVETLFKQCVQQAKGEGSKQETGLAAKTVEEWVGAHKMRVSTVDLCAWFCFAVGVVRVLTP